MANQKSLRPYIVKVWTSVRGCSKRTDKMHRFPRLEQLFQFGGDSRPYLEGFSNHQSQKNLKKFAKFHPQFASLRDYVVCHFFFHLVRVAPTFIFIRVPKLASDGHLQERMFFQRDQRERVNLLNIYNAFEQIKKTKTILIICVLSFQPAEINVSKHDNCTPFIIIILNVDELICLMCWKEIHSEIFVVLVLSKWLWQSELVSVKNNVFVSCRYSLDRACSTLWFLLEQRKVILSVRCAPECMNIVEACGAKDTMIYPRLLL